MNERSDSKSVETEPAKNDAPEFAAETSPVHHRIGLGKDFLINLARRGETMTNFESRNSLNEQGKEPDRRSFLKLAGMAAAAAVAFGVDVPGLRLNEAFAQSGAVDLGGGDVGVLNYAYALEQLEAAFYTNVIATPYAGMSGYERSTLRDIRDHEIAHRSFFAKALGRNRIPNLVPNFSAVNFADRTSVLTTASTFEDLGVSAYNGGGAAIKSAAYLAAAGSIVSVEARHAAVLRDMIMPLSSSFAGGDVVNWNGLDVYRSPSQVLPIAAPFIATPVTAGQLP